MSESSPVASVVVPCYEAEKTIGVCLRSLLGQNAKFLYEVIVVDNNSSDRTLAIASGMEPDRPAKIRVFSESLPGAAAARNCGISHARGQFVVFTDADCVASADWLQRMVGWLRESDFALVGGLVAGCPTQRSIVARYARDRQIHSQHNTLRHQRAPYFQTANLAMRLDDVVALGGFDVSLLRGQDADLCWRASAYGTKPIRFDQDAKVLHHQETSLRSFFEQFRGYGWADVSLARKHGANWRHELLKLAADLVRIGLLPLSTALAVIPAIGRRDLLPLASPVLRVVQALARRIGQFEAIVSPNRLRRRRDRAIRRHA